MRTIGLVIALLALAGAGAEARADAIVRRGGAPTLTGTDIRADDAGVRIRSAQGAEHLVPWDRVREVRTGERSLRLDDFMVNADLLWRARSRLERRDTQLAEPLFDRLWPEYVGRTHETALVVAEGLLRCRLARGRCAEAVIPALEVARLRRQGVTTDSYSTLPPVLDETTSLCPLLAPAWGSSRAVARLERDLRDYDPGRDEIVSALRNLYLAAARRRSGIVAATPPSLAGGHPGVDLLAAVVACGDDAAETRAAARRDVFDLAAELGPWASAWARYAAGTSLLDESGEGRHQRGLLHLAWLPARYERDQPFLSRLAMARMVRRLEEMGADAGAASLAEAYVRRFGTPPEDEAVQPGEPPEIIDNGNQP